MAAPAVTTSPRLEHPARTCYAKHAMILQINGERREVSGPKTVGDLLAFLGLSTARVAVEKNLVLVPRKDHATAPLHDGDALEIVHFVGGG